MRPPIASAMLAYPPLAIAGAGGGKYVVGGGGGRAAKGLANRLTVLESEGGELLLRHHEEFESRVEAVVVDDSSKIYVHAGDAVYDLTGGMGGMSSPPMKKTKVADLAKASSAGLARGEGFEASGARDVLGMSASGECLAASSGSSVLLFKRNAKVPASTFGGVQPVLLASDASGKP